MNENRITDMADILHLGRQSQNNLAALNQVVTERLKEADYSRVYALFDELLTIAEETDMKKLAQKEERLDGMSSDLSVLRMELLKEQELLRALRDTNDHYTEVLQGEIDAGNAFVAGAAAPGMADVITMQETMKKRMQELVMTRSVGMSFSEQIKLAEANLTSLSDRIWNVLMHLIPLLRGRLSVEHSRIMVAEIQKVIGSEPKPVG